MAKTKDGNEGDAIAAALEASNDWESSTVEMLEKSERRAWVVAKSAVALAVALGIAIAGMMPLKRVELRVVRVNDTTGRTEIITELDVKKISLGEAQDGYWLGQYVQARETYNWYTLQRDYDTVGLLSSQQVALGYGALFEGKDALDKKLGQSVRINAKVLTVIPDGKGTATVRFTKTAQRSDEATPSGRPVGYVATISYEYRGGKSDSNARLVNPFGFVVTSYRVDAEIVSMTPAPAQPAPQQAPAEAR